MTGAIWERQEKYPTQNASAEKIFALPKLHEILLF